MRTIRTKVYQFNELSENAKQKAIELLYDINVNYNWWLNTYEDAESIGLKIKGFELDRNRHCAGDFILAANEVALNITNEHGTECDTYKTAVNFMELWQPVFVEYMDENSEHYESRESENELQDIESEFLNSLLKDYSIILQNECEYLQSEDAIIETIEENEYEFTSTGNLFN